MSRTFAGTLGHNIAVWQAVEILYSLTFTGPPPTVPRDELLRSHWNRDGTRWLPFSTIAGNWGIHITTVQNEHAAILRRLREHLEGQPPTPTEVSGVGGQA